jgi:hypothetical protein
MTLAENIKVLSGRVKVNVVHPHAPKRNRCIALSKCVAPILLIFLPSLQKHNVIRGKEGVDRVHAMYLDFRSTTLFEF